MKILITGANGILGLALQDEARSRGIAIDLFDRALFLEGEIDASRLAANGYEAIIHCAALTDVEACEREPELAYVSNVGLTQALLSFAEATGTKKFVYISSTGVYGTAKDTAYEERDRAVPTTEHHRSKVMAEDAALLSPVPALVIRTGWLFGGHKEQKKNFVWNRIREGLACIENGQPMFANSGQHGNPSSVIDVARKIWQLIELDKRGIYNCVNRGEASRFEYVSEIIKDAALDIQVQPIDSTQFKRLAPVSFNEMAWNSRLADEGLDDMPAWRDSLASYIRTLIDTQ